MSKKSRRKRKRRQPPPRRFPWRWLAVGGATLVVAVIALVLWPGSGDGEPQATPQVFGAPRLIVDRTTVDEGYVRYNVPVRTTFHLSNVGDQPLKILGEPQVQLAEGC